MEPDVELVASAAEDWQNDARRQAAEAPRTHVDGSPMPQPVATSRPGLPVLPADPAIARAIALLRSQVSAPPQEEPAPAVQP